MDEKTEELRDLFIEVTEADTVTESQEESHGSLASDADVERRLAVAIAHMRDALGFVTDLSDDELVAVVRGYYAGDDDPEIADRLDGDPETVARARLDLHLVDDGDVDPGVDLDALRNRPDSTDADLAGDLDSDLDTVHWHRRVVETRDERRRVGDRYRDEFESILQDRDLSERLTANVREDGLDDATEGMENDLSL